MWDGGFRRGIEYTRTVVEGGEGEGRFGEGKRKGDCVKRCKC